MTEKKALVKNCADPQQVREAEAKVKWNRETELVDIKFLLSTPQGRRFIWRLINVICHYDAVSANNSGSMTYLLEGERSVGKLIKADCYEADLEAYHLMEKEYYRDNGK